MQIHRPMNMTILEIKFNNETYNFFVDSGMPFSFSTNHKQIHEIPAEYMVQKQPMPLGHPPRGINISDLERLSGVKLAGFLGNQFLSQANLRFDLSNNYLGFEPQIPDWTPDFVLPLQGWVTELECKDGGNDGQQSWFIDTGSYLSFRWHNNARLHPDWSPNWKLPTFMGDARFDFYPHCPIFHNHNLLTEVTTALIHAPGPHYAGMLGANFLVQFDCYFDFSSKQLRLKKNHRDVQVWENPSTSYQSCGFQFEFVWKDNKRQLRIAHHLVQNTHIPPVGTIFSIPNLDLTDMFCAYKVWEYLFPTHRNPISIQVADQIIELPTHPLFIPK